MNSKKYIVMVPVIESELDLLKFSETRYTWVLLWDDLRGLNGKCIFDEFKIFVNQEDPASAPSKLFVCTLINGESREEAYKKGVENILALSNGLVNLFLRGFEPMYHETIVIPFHPSELMPTIEDTINVELVELTIKNGNVDRIATPYSVWKPNFPLRGKASHKEYVTTYFKIRKIEGDISEIPMPAIRMLQEEVLLNIESQLKKIEASKSSSEANLMNMVATLYSAAITIENISVSYLLLWQVLESFASSKDAGRKSLCNTTMGSIGRLLEGEGYDNATVHRVNSILGMLREKNDVQIIAEMLKEYLFPNEDIDVVRQKVEKLREIRGAITHPRPSKRLDMNELQTNYKELREIVDELLRKLRLSKSASKPNAI